MSSSGNFFVVYAIKYLSERGWKDDSVILIFPLDNGDVFLFSRIRMKMQHKRCSELSCHGGREESWLWSREKREIYNKISTKELRNWTERRYNIFYTFFGLSLLKYRFCSDLWKFVFAFSCSLLFLSSLPPSPRHTFNLKGNRFWYFRYFFHPLPTIPIDSLHCCWLAVSSDSALITLDSAWIFPLPPSFLHGQTPKTNFIWYFSMFQSEKSKS